MRRYSVTAPALNLRSTPSSSDTLNILGRLSFRTVVEVVNHINDNWWEVRTIFNNLSGFVASRYLEPVMEKPIIIDKICKADYPTDVRASLFGKDMMHKPIGSPIIPYRQMTDATSRRKSIQNIIELINVSQNIRHQRTKKYTFCNIYAYDICHFARAYIPRVWWNSKAIKKLQNGEKLELLYGETVYEMNANALHDWLLEWGDDFGWIRMTEADGFQNIVNNTGGIGVICAKRKDRHRSGHITVVVPEIEAKKAYRKADKVFYPLQSQAGAYNYNYFSEELGAWWLRDRFASFVFFFHS